MTTADKVLDKYPAIREYIKQYGAFNVTKLWEHDCDDCCIYLGGIGQYDIYYHGEQFPTVVARFGDYGGDYLSGPDGLLLSKHYPRMPGIN